MIKMRTEIKSFVRREGRLTTGQARALKILWPQYGLPFNTIYWDWLELFGNQNPVVLEIGFGNGESLAKMTIRETDINFVGIEVYRPGIGHLLHIMQQQEIKNLRISRHDAVAVLQHQVATQSLAGVQIFFPDPWHKKRHHKRRLIQPDFVQLLAERLQSGAFVHCATDWEHYAVQINTVFTQAAEFTLADKALYQQKKQLRPKTRFEQRGMERGHKVWDLVYNKC